MAVIRQAPVFGATLKSVSAPASVQTVRLPEAVAVVGPNYWTAKKALELKIGTVVFDRNGYKYHGVVKALADGAREGGLKF